MTRREAREIGFALLFEWSFHNEELAEMIQNAAISRDIEVDSFARQLAEKTIAHHAEIDGIIEQYSQGWKLSRLSRVTLAVLRLSFCELTRMGDIPVGASINEAVELAKKYGSEDEAAYVNGILGNFERVRKGLAPEPPKPVKQSEPQPHEPVFEAAPDKPPVFLDDEVELVQDLIIEVE